MKKLAKAAFAFVLTWFVVVPAFVMATHAERVLQQAESDEYEISWTFQAPIYAFAFVGLAADFAFNISYGTVAYRQIPGGWTFTATSTGLLNDPGWRGEKARDWCELLHRVDPGHCGGWEPVTNLGTR